jgi:hypothetical protein
MKKFLFIIMLVFAASVFTPVAAQCPMCKTALESNMKDGEKPKGTGINKGILYLLAMPFLAFIGIGGAYYYNIRRNAG